jgi:hypothetical protein
MLARLSAASTAGNSINLASICISSLSFFCGSSVQGGKMLHPPAEFVGAMGQLAKATGQDELQVCPRLFAETPVRVLGISI